MRRRDFIALIGLSAAWPTVPRAEQQPTLGLLSSSEMADWAIGPFRAGLEEGGYVEGGNLTVIRRSAGATFIGTALTSKKMGLLQIGRAHV